MEASLKANLSGSGELASGAVMLGPPGSLPAPLGSVRLGSALNWEYGCLAEICLREER